MAEIKDYSTTAGSNNSASPNGMPEGMAPSGVNDAWREGTARLKRWYDDISAVNSLAGGTTTYTLAASRTISAYAAGDMFVAVCNATCVDSPTLNVDSVGAKAIVDTQQTALTAGQLTADGIYGFVYDANNDVFQCLNPSPASVSLIDHETAVTTTSGSSKSFTGIRATAKRITMFLMEVSTDGTAKISCQLGTSSGLKTTGYVGAKAFFDDATAVSVGTASSGLEVTTGGSGTLLNGCIIWTLADPATNTWTGTAQLGRSNSGEFSESAVSVALSGTCDRVALVTTDAFDAGKINVMIEG